MGQKKKGGQTAKNSDLQHLNFAQTATQSPEQMLAPTFLQTRNYVGTSHLFFNNDAFKVLLGLGTIQTIMLEWETQRLVQNPQFFCWKWSGAVVAGRMTSAAASAIF